MQASKLRAEQRARQTLFLPYQFSSPATTVAIVTISDLNMPIFHVQDTSHRHNCNTTMDACAGQNLRGPHPHGRVHVWWCGNTTTPAKPKTPSAITYSSFHTLLKGYATKVTINKAKRVDAQLKNRRPPPAVATLPALVLDQSRQERGSMDNNKHNCDRLTPIQADVLQKSSFRSLVW
jgi:hypothetical protein